MVLRNVWKHALLGGSGGMPPRKILEFRTSKIASGGFSCQVSVAKIMYISSIQEALLLLFAHGANLKLQQANTREQAKVAQAFPQVHRGLATPLHRTKVELHSALFMLQVWLLSNRTRNVR